MSVFSQFNPSTLRDLFCKCTWTAAAWLGCPDSWPGPYFRSSWRRTNPPPYPYPGSFRRGRTWRSELRHHSGRRCEIFFANGHLRFGQYFPWKQKYNQWKESGDFLAYVLVPPPIFPFWNIPWLKLFNRSNLFKLEYLPKTEMLAQNISTTIEDTYIEFIDCSVTRGLGVPVWYPDIRLELIKDPRRKT